MTPLRLLGASLLVVCALAASACGGGTSSGAEATGQPISFRQLAQSASTSAEAKTGRFSFDLSFTFPGADGDLANFPDVSELGGTSPANLVNRLSSTGIQLEQSLGVRNHPQLAGAVADGTAWAIAEMLGLGSPAIVASAAAS